MKFNKSSTFKIKLVCVLLIRCRQKFDSNPYHSKQSGFTIIELMIVVAMAGILLAVAVPSFQTTLKDSRIRTSATDVYLSLVMARSEAIKRNANITVDAGSTDWSNGWDIKTGATILKTEEAIPGNISIECNTDADTAAETCPTTVTFERTGRVTSLVEFRLFDSNENKVSTRCVSISLSGRPRIERDTNNNYVDGC